MQNSSQFWQLNFHYIRKKIRPKCWYSVAKWKKIYLIFFRLFCSIVNVLQHGRVCACVCQCECERMCECVRMYMCGVCVWECLCVCECAIKQPKVGHLKDQMVFKLECENCWSNFTPPGRKNCLNRSNFAVNHPIRRS